MMCRLGTIGVPSGPSVTVRVPATSANLGPGFDSFGLALARYDEVSACLTDGGLLVQVSGVGAGEVPLTREHLVVRAIDRAFALADQPLPGLHLHCTNCIPHGGGLGSSAAAIVAGVLAGRQLVADGGGRLLSDAEVLALCTEMEGHPDNVAATVHGGFTIAWTDGGEVGVLAAGPHADLLPVAFVPGTELKTTKARKALPATVPHAEAATNSGRAALLGRALIERPDLLMVATEDFLHQEYRRPVMPRSLALVDELRAAGIPAVVSGAGPTVLALTTRDRAQGVAAKSRRGWRSEVLEVDRQGVQILPL